MRASDVMVSEVITVAPSTTVQEIADTLLTNRISAVPVVDEKGALVGIVSEGDLLHRVEAGTERRYSWWLKLVSGRETLARDFVKSHGTKAADVMTKRVVTAGPDLPLGDIASLLERHRIKRVPIVKNGKLIGIVSRANLVQALAALRKDIPSEATVEDATLRTTILAEFRSNLEIAASQVNVIVHGGTVELWGEVNSLDEKDAVRVAAEAIPGVVAVEDHTSLSKFHHGI